MCEFVHNVISFFEYAKMICSELRTWIWIISAPNLEQFNYNVIGQVRNCAFHKVYRCHNYDEDQMVFIKEIFIPDECDTELRRSLAAKFNFLRSFNQGNVLSMQDVFRKGRYLYIVYDYFSIDLNYMINSMPKLLRVPQIKLILRQILSAVHQYHSDEIILGDIKPEYLQLKVAERSVRLADFGFAGAFGDPWASYPIKTSQYSAPELLFKTRQYSKAADLWSVGCIFGELVTGKPVFPGKTPRERLMSIFRLLGTPTEESWPGVSKMCRTFSCFPKYDPKDLAENFPGLEAEGIDLLSKLLCLDPNARISTEDALAHEYFAFRKAPLMRGHAFERITARRKMMEIADEMTSVSPPERRYSY